MPVLTIRNVSPEVRDYLRKTAAEHGRSMEAEVRAILERAMRHGQTRPGETARRIHERFAALGGADDLPLPGKAALENPVSFGK